MGGTPSRAEKCPKKSWVFIRKGRVGRRETKKNRREKKNLGSKRKQKGG